MELTPEILKKLTAPFPEADLQWVTIVKGKEGKPDGWAPYVDARQIQSRLDDVVGPANWETHLDPLGTGAIICRLTICGITKSDVGEVTRESDSPMKTAASDALKRAAVVWGISRYLYDRDPVWLTKGQKPGARNVAQPDAPARVEKPTQAAPKPQPARTGGGDGPTPPAPPSNGVKPVSSAPAAPPAEAPPSVQVRTFAKTHNLPAETLCDMLRINPYCNAQFDPSKALNIHARTLADEKSMTSVEGAWKLILDELQAALTATAIPAPKQGQLR